MRARLVVKWFRGEWAAVWYNHQRTALPAHWRSLRPGRLGAGRWVFSDGRTYYAGEGAEAVADAIATAERMVRSCAGLPVEVELVISERAARAAKRAAS